MKLSSESIRKHRLDRGWTQEHLAEVSGLSKRTIQRLERDGEASSSTALSLAATFNVQLASLRREESRVPWRISTRSVGFACASLVTFVSLGIAVLNLPNSVVAADYDQIVVNMTISRVDKSNSESSLTTALQFGLNDEVGGDLYGLYHIGIRSRSVAERRVGLVLVLKEYAEGLPVYVGSGAVELEIGTSSDIQFNRGEDRFSVLLDSSYAYSSVETRKENAFSNAGDS